MNMPADMVMISYVDDGKLVGRTGREKKLRKGIPSHTGKSCYCDWGHGSFMAISSLQVVLWMLQAASRTGFL